MNPAHQDLAAIAALASALGLTAHLVAQRPGWRAARAFVPASFVVCLGAVTGSALVAVAALFLWIGVPVLLALAAMRRVCVRRNREMEPLQPRGEIRHTVDHLASAWETLGFRRTGDFHLSPSTPAQTYHFLLSPDARHLAFVGCVLRGEDLVFSYDAVMSWTPAGQQWLTWNYPLPYGVRSAPETRLWRCTGAMSPESLLEQHVEFMQLNGAEARAFPDLAADGAVQAVWSAWLRRQVDYNVDRGWLQLKNDGQDVVYTARGLFGAARQFLAAFVTGSPRP